MSAKNVQFKILIVKYLKLYIQFVGRSIIRSIRLLNFRSLLYLLSEKNQAACLPLFSQILSILLVFDIFSYAGLTQTLFEHSSKKNKTRKIAINLYFIKRYFTTTIWTRRELQFIWSESLYCPLVAKRCQCIITQLFLMHL